MFKNALKLQKPEKMHLKNICTPQDGVKKWTLMYEIKLDECVLQTLINTMVLNGGDAVNGAGFRENGPPRRAGGGAVCRRVSVRSSRPSQMFRNVRRRGAFQWASDDKKKTKIIKNNSTDSNKNEIENTK